jgi:predicted methyltransferase
MPSRAAGRRASFIVVTLAVLLAPATFNPTTHRINEQFVIDELQAAGFELVERSDLLAVPDDDYNEMGFPTPWNEDRMLLKFRKPAATR